MTTAGVIVGVFIASVEMDKLAVLVALAGTANAFYFKERGDDQ